jgi:hypothetical protein
VTEAEHSSKSSFNRIIERNIKTIKNNKNQNGKFN